MKTFTTKIKKFITHPTYMGIEIVDDVDKGTVYHFIELKNEEDELELSKTQSNLSFGELIELVPKRSQIALVVNQNFVLTKSIQGKQEEKQALTSAFPNTDVNSFFYEVYKSDHSTFVSICRKNKIDEIINRFLKHQIAVTSLSFGNPIASVLKDINQRGHIHTSNAKVEISDNDFNITKEEVSDAENYFFEGLEIGSPNVLSFCAALNLFFKNFGTKTNFESLVSKQASFYKNINFNYNFPRLSLAVVFVILIINTVFYFNYSDKVEPLLVYDSSIQNRLNELEELKNEVERIEKSANKISNQNTDETIYFINQVLKSLPNTIILSELNYQPVSKSIKKGEDLMLAEDLISLKGQTNSNKSLSDWLLELENYEWVEDIVITDFKNDSSEGQFELNLKIDLK